VGFLLLLLGRRVVSVVMSMVVLVLCFDIIEKGNDVKREFPDKVRDRKVRCIPL
jgi:hypothetical protein